jgi:hypothetical protein
MASANEILVNAERLISDAEHLFADGRSRSASTLIVALDTTRQTSAAARP